MHIVLTGNTGSGKTTTGKALAESLGLPLISSGDVARALSNSDPSTRLALEQGAMAPEQPMRAAIRSAIEEADIRAGGWVLDGFPRTIPQLICLLQWSSGLPLFVSIDLDDWTCIERLVARGRAHDHADAIARRIEGFHEKTGPMIATLYNGGVLIETDGRQPTRDQVDQIRSILT